MCACLILELLFGRHCFVYRVGGTTTWIQHGMVLVNWKSTRTDNADSAGQALLGQTYRDFIFRDYSRKYNTKSGKEWVRRIEPDTRRAAYAQTSTSRISKFGMFSCGLLPSDA